MSTGSYELLLRSEFEARHHLRMQDDTLEDPHDHDWHVEVYLEGRRLDGTDMLADFTVLQQKLSRIIGTFQDTRLNDLSPFSDRNPSAELVAAEICRRFEPQAPAGVRVTKVRVWETDRCAAAFIPAAPNEAG